MNQNEEPKAELIIVGDEWERFVSTLERFISLHQKSLQRLNELNNRNEALRQELRDAISISTIHRESEKTGPRSVEKEEKDKIEHPVSTTVQEFSEAVQPIETEKYYVRQQPLKAKLGFLSKFSRIVRSEATRTFQPSNPIGAYASCEKCGYQIKRVSRFCEGCGGDFGALTCSCGRQLNQTDKFCDHCGRTI
jgi:hypothetical protein